MARPAGFEPATLCLEGKCSSPTELRARNSILTCGTAAPAVAPPKVPNQTLSAPLLVEGCLSSAGCCALSLIHCSSCLHSASRESSDALLISETTRHSHGRTAI